MLLKPTAFSCCCSATTTTTTPPPFHHHHHHHHHHHIHLHKRSIRTTTTTTTRRALHNFRVSLSPNNPPHQTPPPVIASAVTTSSSSSSSLVLHINSASEVVRNFYSGINGRDLASVENLIAVNCVYEDLIFPHPFTGRKEILEFFHKFIDTISADLQFVIDDISNEDNSAVGVTWHLEWKGKPFPFSKGCSFYRLEVVNGKRQIIYGRDSVEPSIKPGETALVAIRGVTWLLQQFPQLADLL